MPQDVSKHGTPVKNDTKSTGTWLYRHGVIFSAAMMVISLVSGLGTQLANKLGINKAETAATEAENKLLPYETPSFHIFSSIINDAAASFAIVNVATMGE